MLLSAGVGGDHRILGLGPPWQIALGRKPLLIAGITLCALGAGSVSLIPEGAWVLFAVLRFIVGFGLGAAATIAVPLIVEYTPTRHRAPF